MIDKLKDLIEALRAELEHYGEMLALLDQQQEQVMTRNAAEVLSTVASINQQSVCIQTARRQRCQRLHELARLVGGDNSEESEETTFERLLPQLPADYQPLVQALVEENNALLVRVRQRARQNHLLLSRSVELMQGLLTSLLPPGRPTLYDGTGQRFAPVPGRQTFYEAVG